MTVKKRGLGRGLEALLVDVASKEEMHQSQTQSADSQSVKGAGRDDIQIMPAPVSDDLDTEVVVSEMSEVDSGLEQRSTAMQGAIAEPVDDKAAIVMALFKNIQKEHLVLLEEAEALKKLIEEFEAMVRADLS